MLAATGEMPYGDLSLPAGTGGARLELQHVGYSYDPDQTVLDDVTFAVEPGRTVAVVGATASGKCTLTTLLTRLVDPDRGRILVDGVDLRDLAHGALAEGVAVVAQTAFLFDDTVRGNVTLGADVSDAEVWEALRIAQADGFVAALPHGLDTRLGERGTSLSGGQRQRISLARALVRRPRLLILDDATSAVDPEVEARILGALRSGVGATPSPRRRRLPQGHHRAGRRGRLPRRRAGRRPRAARDPARPQPGVRPAGQRLRDRPAEAVEAGDPT